jgi:hypothetical protein
VSSTTHFIQVPLNLSPALKKSFETLKTKLLERNIAGIKREKNFFKSSLLHLSLMRLDLSDSKRLHAAKDVFAALEPIIKTQLAQIMKGAMVLHFKGLIGAMDDNLTDVEKAKVIFCEPVQD